MWRYIIPLAIFLGLGVLFWAGLGNDPRHVPSPLIDKPAPQFSLPVLGNREQTLSRDDLLGKPYLLNVWASWCYACRVEHQVVTRFAQAEIVPVYGLNYKDQWDDAQRWLRQFGDPYAASAFDESGRVSIDFGVYGAPETFLIDAQGVIRFKHIGPLSPEVISQDILPLLLQLDSSS